MKLFLIFSAFFVSVFIAASHAESLPKQRTEFLKDFLEKRPSIEGIIFSTTPLMSDKAQSYIKQRTGKLPARLAINKSTDPVFGRWETNGCFIHVGKDFDILNIKDGDGLYGVKNQKFWQISYPVLTWFEGDSPEAVGLQSLISSLEQALGFGLPTLRRSSVRWSENEFTASDTKGMPMKGRLKLDESGNPVSLLCETQGEWDYEIQYSYDDVSKEKLYPQKCLTRVILKSNKNPEPILETVFASLVISSTPLPESMISPESFIPKEKLLSVISSNGVEYKVLANNTLYRIGKTAVPNRHPSAVRGWIYVALAVLAILPVALLIKSKRSNGAS